MEKKVVENIIKERLEEWIIWFLVLVAVTQIGLSRMYIDAITYTYSTIIGIYLFGFTLSNMVYLFIIFSIKENVKKFSLSLIAVLISIVYFSGMILKIFYEELNIDKVLRIGDILQPSIYLGAGVGLMVVGTLAMFILNRKTTRGIM